MSLNDTPPGSGDAAPDDAHDPGTTDGSSPYFVGSNPAASARAERARPDGADGRGLRSMTAIYFDRTYHETMSLLLEARDYLAFREPIERRGMTVDHRLAVNCEALRLTSRLTHIMAWLLVQKAVYAGELTAAEAAAEDYRLAGQSVCRQTEAPGRVSMPSALQSLLDRSYQLYTRVERLDAMVAQSVTH